MKYIILCFAYILILSCNKKNVPPNLSDKNYNELVFHDKSFEDAFKKSLTDLEIDLEGANKNIIIQFYIDPKENYDTIIDIKNCPPVSVKDLLLVKKYKDQNIFIYTTENLVPRFNKLIELSNDSLDSVNLKPVRGEFECIYTKSFKLDNKKITPKE